MLSVSVLSFFCYTWVTGKKSLLYHGTKTFFFFGNCDYIHNNIAIERKPNCKLVFKKKSIKRCIFSE